MKVIYNIQTLCMSRRLNKSGLSIPLIMDLSCKLKSGVLKSEDLSQ